MIRLLILIPVAIFLYLLLNDRVEFDYNSKSGDSSFDSDDSSDSSSDD